MNSDERRELVERVLFAAQRARSSYHEFSEQFEDSRAVRESVLAGTQPYLSEDHPLNLIKTCINTLEPERIVEPINLYNVLYLAHKTETIRVWFASANIKFPEPMEAFA